MKTIVYWGLYLRPFWGKYHVWEFRKLGFRLSTGHHTRELAIFITATHKHGPQISGDFHLALIWALNVRSCSRLDKIIGLKRWDEGR